MIKVQRGENCETLCRRGKEATHSHIWKCKSWTENQARTSALPALSPFPG